MYENYQQNQNQNTGPGCLDLLIFIESGGCVSLIVVLVVILLLIVFGLQIADIFVQQLLHLFVSILHSIGNWIHTIIP
jgi:hypothetical protein